MVKALIFLWIRAYALVLLCLDTGTRNKEIRFAEVGDLDTKSWTLDIVHVKGEATYGEPRIVPIREEIRPVIARYLAARAKWVIEHDCPSKALFPSGDERSSTEGRRTGWRSRKREPPGPPNPKNNL